ncbi:hypothetical protein EH220_00460, partial [bacterium]
MIAVFLLFASFVHAEYPLGKVVEFQLPVNDCWDVQHWLDSDSYGWVTANGTEISYCLDIANPEIVTFEFTPMFCVGYEGIEEYITEHIYLRIWGSIEESLHQLLVATEAIDPNYFALVNFSRLNIDTQQQEFPVVDCIIIASECSGGHYCFSWGDINELYVWPPPPLSAGWLIVNLACHRDFEGQDDLYEHSEQAGGVIKSLSDTNLYYQRWAMESSDPFAVYDSLILAGEGHYNFWDCWDHSYGSEGLEISRLSRYYLHADSLYTTITCDTDTSFEGWACDPVRHLCGYPSRPAAQVDADGTRRMINRTGDCYAVVGNDYVWQWSNPELEGTSKYTATMSDSPDERLLVSRGNHFDVYDAADGTLLGTTSNWQGTFKYVLKQPNRASEFLTIDNNRVVRIYKPTIGLTLHVLADSNS